MTLYPQGAEPAKPRLTERQVLQIASEFCRKFVRETGAAPEKCRPTDKRPEFEADNASTPTRVSLFFVFGPNWIVRLPNSAQLRIQDSSGLVVWMEGESRKQILGAVLTPARQKLLIDRVNKYKSVFWTKNDVFSTERSIHSEHNTDSFGTTNLTFSYIWERRFRGIPYRNQDLHVTVTMAGDLMAASLRGWTPEPKNLRANVSEGKARETALKIASASYDLPNVPVTCSKWVIEKKRFWEHKYDADRIPGSAFIAWMVDIPLRAPGQRHFRQLTIGIDAESGEPIFSEVIGSR
jgi:hypothetical protein